MEENQSNNFFLECEKRWVYFTLIFVGGFYGAFTYNIRGGVFCNAQTANFVLLAMAIGKKDISQALYLIIPISAYLLGAIVSEILPNTIKKHYKVRWDTTLILIEMIAVLLLGFLPESAPFQITQVVINFICSMQYNTFRQAQGVPVATTFCTNHLRQVGIGLVNLFRHPEDKKNKTKFETHLLMLLCFVVGGILATILSNLFLGHSIWIAEIPLLVIWISLLRADLIKEKDSLDLKPHGH